MKKAFLTLGLLFLCTGTALSQSRTVELVKSDVQAGVDFPATWVDTMMAETVDEITRIKKFDRVILVTE